MRNHEYKAEPDLFIDAGGHDGCSVIAFLLVNPLADCITIEPNPELWEYYRFIPCKLIKKALAGNVEKRPIAIDTFDADGSSIIKNKPVFYQDKERISDMILDVDCIKLSDLLGYYAAGRKAIVKLDIEGAEYEVLEEVIKAGKLTAVKKIYCEFHSSKLPEMKGREEKIKSLLRNILVEKEWDAISFSLLNKLKRKTSILDIFMLHWSRIRLILVIRTARVLRWKKLPYHLARQDFKKAVKILDVADGI